MVTNISSDRSDMLLSSAHPLRPLRPGGEFYDVGAFTAETQRSPGRRRDFLDAVIDGLKQRWFRERRRRKVGRAYDMALEIARLVPRGSEILDVGCGNGFIAHHLSAMLGTRALGIDLSSTAAAPIDYRRYDGTHFPMPNESVDAVLLCYVLHHAQDIDAVLSETRRVLRHGGLAVVYEDIPQVWADRVVCWFHNRQWRNRSGSCTFRSESDWRSRFESSGFEVLTERSLSRWRNLIHPVCRRLYLLKAVIQLEVNKVSRPRTRPSRLPDVHAPRHWSCTNRRDNSSTEAEFPRLAPQFGAPPIP